MYLDWRGKEIKVGSTVVYPTRMGSSMSVHEGKVLEIIDTEPKPNFNRETNEWGESTRWSFKLVLETIEHHWNWNRETKTGVFEDRLRRTHGVDVHRVTVVD